MGNRRKPTALRLLEGNASHRPLINEPRPQSAATPPPPPKFLDQIAAGEWQRVAPTLHHRGLLTNADITMLAAYCCCFSRWRNATAALADPANGGLMIKNAKGNTVRNPLAAVAHRASEMMVKLAREFGLTPSARSRIDVGPKADSNPMARLFD